MTPDAADDAADDPALVPELLVSDLAASLRFWRDACGFSVRYERPEEGFAYLVLGRAHLMLDTLGIGRDWITGPLERPFGRGVNLQIAVDDVDALVERMRVAGHPLFLEAEERWYRAGGVEVGLRQFVVSDPDGYLVRFQTPSGTRPTA